MNSDTMRTLMCVTPLGEGKAQLKWSDGTVAELDLPDAPAAAIGDWGHSLVWPDGHEIGADSLWLDTLNAIGRGDARQFLEWRMAHGLSLKKAADALGLARRTVVYYSNGDRPVPKTVLLACKGWEAVEARKAA